ncbi:hypothetical protein O7632_19570 [Solwaraspora sp. WMMD406]|uniref:DUF2231 domain-containing protein n=1 Tax=Solwaraspora sp. WMMD406 TaxID=3016095 RepID=UPI002417E4EC|nr:DUF2231 domain-containing protein [Solwaraspora sp. WMMD406]MDG4766285.1 hypothetical protein [Solwaraspora sp. WMMD406]
MDSRQRVPGHPIQPMLVTLPLGLFVCATLFDVSTLAGGPTLFGEVGYWTMVAGLVAMAVTTGAGLIDLWDEPAGAFRSALVRFNLFAAGMGAVFLLVCLIRAGTTVVLVRPALLLVELVGLGVGGVGLRYVGALLRHSGDSSVTDLDHRITVDVQGGQTARGRRA